MFGSCVDACQLCPVDGVGNAFPMWVNFVAVFFCWGKDSCCAGDFDGVSNFFFSSAAISIDHGVVVCGGELLGRGRHGVPSGGGGMSGGLGGGLGVCVCAGLGWRGGRGFGRNGRGVFRGGG